MDATLNSLDDAKLHSENWVLQLQDAREELKAAKGIEVTYYVYVLFKKEWPSLLSDSSKITYPASLDPSQKMCYQPSGFLIHRKCPSSLLMSYLYMEEVQFKFSLASLGEIYQLNYLKELNLRRQPLSLLTSAQRGKCIVSSLQPNDNISMQLKELLTNDLHRALFPNLHKLATICLSMPISTASAERNFSDMKLIKNRLRNCLTELSLSNLMKIIIESPEKLTDNDLEDIVDMWSRKGRWIAV